MTIVIVMLLYKERSAILFWFWCEKKSRRSQASASRGGSETIGHLVPVQLLGAKGETRNHHRRMMMMMMMGFLLMMMSFLREESRCQAALIACCNKLAEFVSFQPV
jgi:hypothetical protein